MTVAGSDGPLIGGQLVKKVKNRKQFGNSVETIEEANIKDRARGQLIEMRNEFKAVISNQYLNILLV